MDPGTDVTIRLSTARKYRFFRLAALCLLLLPIGAYATESRIEQEVVLSARDGLTYLLSFVGPAAAGSETFQPDRISEILRFVTGAKDPHVLYHGGTFNGAACAYHEIDIRRGLDHILRLTYNPDIPAVAMMPASVRLAYWAEIDTPDNALPKIWEALPASETPQFFKGVEHIVNSPDQHSGAYFEYDLYRTLILMKYDGRDVFISLSRQKNVSDVGKKGVIVGPDGNWDYLYTGQAGVSYAGLGWVKSYMYDSYSVSFYVATEIAAPIVRLGVFKWMRAGWAGINLARPSHIFSGLERFAESFKMLLENPHLADAAEVSRVFASLKRLSDKEQRKIIEGCLVEIEKKCRLERQFSDDYLKALSADRYYIDGLNEAERESLIALAQVKKLLGGAPSLELMSPRPKSSDAE